MKSYLQTFWGVDRWCSTYGGGGEDTDEYVNVVSDLGLCTNFGCHSPKKTMKMKNKKTHSIHINEVPKVISIGNSENSSTCSDTISSLWDPPIEGRGGEEEEPPIEGRGREEEEVDRKQEEVCDLHLRRMTNETTLHVVGLGDIVIFRHGGGTERTTSRSESGMPSRVRTSVNCDEEGDIQQVVVEEEVKQHEESCDYDYDGYVEFPFGKTNKPPRRPSKKEHPWDPALIMMIQQRKAKRIMKQRKDRTLQDLAEYPFIVYPNGSKKSGPAYIYI